VFSNPISLIAHVRRSHPSKEKSQVDNESPEMSPLAESPAASTSATRGAARFQILDEENNEEEESVESSDHGFVLFLFFFSKFLLHFLFISPSFLLHLFFFCSSFSLYFFSFFFFILFSALFFFFLNCALIPTAIFSFPFTTNLNLLFVLMQIPFPKYCRH